MVPARSAYPPLREYSNSMTGLSPHISILFISPMTLTLPRAVLEKGHCLHALSLNLRFMIQMFDTKGSFAIIMKYIRPYEQCNTPKCR